MVLRDLVPERFRPLPPLLPLPLPSQPVFAPLSVKLCCTYAGVPVSLFASSFSFASLRLPQPLVFVCVRAFRSAVPQERAQLLRRLRAALCPHDSNT